MIVVREVLRLLRPRQWVKNGFVLVPLFFNAGVLHQADWLRAIAAFVIFCLVSSAIYVFNDWMDIEADRQHAKKNTRPLAAGSIPVWGAFVAMFVLAGAASVLGYLMTMPRGFLGVLALYVIVNLGYSAGLKHVTVLELFLVSSGFVLRLLAGGAVVGIPLSPWILVSTGTIALLLTIGKRRGDIAQSNDVQMKRKSLKDYNIAFLDAALAAMTGGTLVVYVLFTVSDYATGRYGQAVIATSIPVAMGLLRYLQLVMVRGDGDSPTDLMLKDRGLVLIVGSFVAIFIALIYLH